MFSICLAFSDFCAFYVPPGIEHCERHRNGMEQKLTKEAIRKALRGTGSQQQLRDGGGLYLEIPPAGGTGTWRLAYRIGGKRRTVTLGPVAEITLTVARQQRDAMKREIADGIDPMARLAKHAGVKPVKVEREGEAQVTFEEAAERYFDFQTRQHRSPATITRNRKMIRDAVKSFGSKRVDAITVREVYEVVSAADESGHREKAKRLRNVTKAITGWAAASGLSPVDPLKGETIPLAGSGKPTVNMPAVIEPDEFGDVVNAIWHYRGRYGTGPALRFMLLNPARGAEVRKTTWDQIDEGGRLWVIPAEVMKMRRDFRSPLADLSFVVLDECREWAANADNLVFPMYGRTMLSGNALSNALRVELRLGGRQTPHGLRASFSSICNASGKFSPEIVDMCLAHKPKDRIEAAYNRHEYLDQRREVMEWWANRISTYILTG